MKESLTGSGGDAPARWPSLEERLGISKIEEAFRAADPEDVEIYGDEAGTMPQSADGDVFVGTGVALPAGVARHLPDRFLHRDQLKLVMLASKAVPVCSYVQPSDKFGRAFGARITQINLLNAGKQRITGGKPGRFIPATGISPGNHVWTYVMTPALGNALAIHVLRRKTTRIKRVRIFLHQKSLKPESKALFEAQPEKFRESAAHAALRLAREGSQPGDAKIFAAVAAILYSSPAPTIQWSDDHAFEGAASGPRLADSFAHGVLKERWKQKREPGFEEALRLDGEGLQVNDVTSLFLRDSSVRMTLALERMMKRLPGRKPF